MNRGPTFRTKSSSSHGPPGEHGPGFIVQEVTMMEVFFGVSGFLKHFESTKNSSVSAFSGVFETF